MLVYGASSVKINVFLDSPHCIVKHLFDNMGGVSLPSLDFLSFVVALVSLMHCDSFTSQCSPHGLQVFNRHLRKVWALLNKFFAELFSSF